MRNGFGSQHEFVLVELADESAPGTGDDDQFDAGNVAAVTMDLRQIHLKSDFVRNRSYLRSI